MKHDGSKQSPSGNPGTAVHTTDMRAAVHATDMREGVQSLELAIAQIDMSLQESDHAVEELIAAITAMAGSMHRIEGGLAALRKSPDAATVEDTINLECRQAEDSMQQAITAFQFYDRLSQRFLHIKENLRAIADVMRAPDQQHPAMWRNLHDKVRSVYSLEQEQCMYQALLRGLSSDNVNKRSDATVQKSCGDIELF